MWQQSLIGIHMLEKNFFLWLWNWCCNALEMKSLTVRMRWRLTDWTLRCSTFGSWICLLFCIRYAKFISVLMAIEFTTSCQNTSFILFEHFHVWFLSVNWNKLANALKSWYFHVFFQRTVHLWNIAGTFTLNEIFFRYCATFICIWGYNFQCECSKLWAFLDCSCCEWILFQAWRFCWANVFSVEKELSLLRYKNLFSGPERMGSSQ